MTLRRKIANMFYGIGHAFESAKVSLSRGNPNTLNPTDASAKPDTSKRIRGTFAEFCAI